MISLHPWSNPPAPARADLDLLASLRTEGVELYRSATDSEAVPHQKALRHLARGRALYTRDDQTAAPVRNLADLHTLGALYLSASTVAGPIGECLRTLSQAGLRGNFTPPNQGFYPLHRLDTYRVLTKDAERVVTFNGLGLFRASGADIGKLYAQEFFRLRGPDRGTADPVLAQQLRDAEDAGYKFSIFQESGSECGDGAVHIFDRLARCPEARLCMQSKGNIKFPIERAMLSDLAKIQAREQEVQDLYDNILAPYHKANACFWKGRASEVIIPAYREFPNAPVAEAVRGMCELWDYVTTHPQGNPHQDVVATKHLQYAESKKPDWMPLGEAGTTLRQLLERVPQQRAYDVAAEIFGCAHDDGRYHELRPHLMSLAPYMNRNEYARMSVDWLQSKPAADLPAACDVARTFMEAGEPLPAALGRFDQLFAERRDGQSVQEALHLYHRVQETLRPFGEEQQAAAVFHGLQSMVEEAPWRDLGAEAAYEKFTEHLSLHRDPLEALARTQAWRPPEQVGRVDREQHYVRLNGVTVPIRAQE